MSDRTLLLVDADSGWLSQTVERLWKAPGMRLLGTAENRKEAEDQLRVYKPDLILVGEGLRKDLSTLARSNPGSHVFLVSGNASGDTWREALAAGARGVVGRNFDPAALLQQVEGLEEQERQQVAQASAPEAAGSRRVGVAAMRQAVIAVWSPKGGAGKTTIAINLAAVFASSPIGPRVCLVDADVDFGDAAAALQVPVGDRTIFQWSQDPAAAERDPMAYLVEVPKVKNLWVLPAPLHVTEEQGITGDFMVHLVGVLRRHFDVVVLDLGTDLRRDSTVLALQQATHVLLVTQPYLPALAEVDMVSEVLEQGLLVPSQHVRMVVNHVHNKRDALVREITQHIHWPVEATLPEDPEVVEAANRGEVAAVSRPDSPFAQGIRRLANKIAQTEVASEPRGPLFKRLFGRRRSA